ncbi:MAG: hypothetical protein ABEJ46_03535 [Gemmatimonadota bacterium]
MGPLEDGPHEQSDDGTLLELADDCRIVDGIYSPKRRTREYRR